MTVSAQVKQTLASLKGVQATLETFATIEKNREAKSLLAHNSRKLNHQNCWPGLSKNWSRS